MNYDFLQNYNMPFVRQRADNQYLDSSHSTMEGAYGTYSMQSSQNTPAVNTAYYGYGGPSNYSDGYQSVSVSTEKSWECTNPDRYIPPAKYGNGHMQYKNFKRKYNAGGGGGAPKKEAPIAEVTADGKLVIFMGRDESYPDGLNSLIHPLSCDLCNIKMNSKALAKDHYESKGHDKRISSWLSKNFTEKGLNPPAIKRFIKQGSTGPDAYYCETCDLKLTSLTHANQHYAGKKHRLVIAQRGKPSGAGYYNSEGKWVRTGTKAGTKSTKDQRFGIGEFFKFSEVLFSTGVEKASENLGSGKMDIITNIADTTTTTESEVKSTGSVKSKTTITVNQDPALFCSICKVSVTSAVQMTMHLSGSKHMKKLKIAGVNTTLALTNTEPPANEIPQAAIVDNVLYSAIKEEIKPDPTDLSVYRTPSGQYYCKTCNTSMSHLVGLEQHLKGKRHLKKQTEEKAMASLAAKKN